MVYPRKRVAGDVTRTVQPREVVQPLEVAQVSQHVAPEFHGRGFYETVAKPPFDRITGIALSIVTLPLVFLIVLGIWMTLGAPAIFRQRRVGLLGCEFTVYKFRTMGKDRRVAVASISHFDRRQNHKSIDDPRHVPFGRFLRKWSLDEIPQFWNIAFGDMAVVGPRPELPDIVARYRGLAAPKARGEARSHRVVADHSSRRSTDA